jgi:hypothetical protein
LSPPFIGFLPNPLGHAMKFLKSWKAKMPAIIDTKDLYTIFTF